MLIIFIFKLLIININIIIRPVIKQGWNKQYFQTHFDEELRGYLLYIGKYYYVSSRNTIILLK